MLVVMDRAPYQANAEFVAKAKISAESYKELLDLSKSDPELFWSKLAREELSWFQDFDQVLDETEAPYYKWFCNGKTNISYNCLDAQIKVGRANKTAIIFEGEAGDTRSISYQELLDEVCRCANALKSQGIKKGDVVCIYMPLCPEAIIAMQACARIGAIHSVVFAGFSAHALKDRLIDGNAKLLITADCILRKGGIINLLEIVSEALTVDQTNSYPQELKQIIYYQRLQDAESCTTIPKNYDLDKNKQLIQQCVINLKSLKTIQLNDLQSLIKDQSKICPAEELDANDTSFILYTSGSTGKPKGIEHRVAGYLLWTKLTMKWVFDIKPKDIYWCTADIGWITGHSYVCYGPLAAGATQFIYEGAPAYPDKDRFWQLIDKHHVSIFYTAPTAIRTFIEWGEEYINKYSLKSLRLLGSVGEPINPEVWRWYYNIIGKKRCPIVDTWWQTETGGLMITTIPGAQTMQAGKAGTALPGINVEVNEDGLLLITRPWPSMLKGIYKDPERYKLAYWSRVIGSYTAGDAALIDELGYIQLAGRIDDVINVSGHRLGTAEIESALVTSPKVAEAAVISVPHAIKGECIIAYAVIANDKSVIASKHPVIESKHPVIASEAKQSIENELKELVSDSIGNFARPERVIICSALPKTRSGKIMRRLLKDIAQGKEPSGDLSTLENPALIEELIRLN